MGEAKRKRELAEKTGVPIVPKMRCPLGHYSHHHVLVPPLTQGQKMWPPHAVCEKCGIMWIPVEILNKLVEKSKAETSLIIKP